MTPPGGAEEGVCGASVSQCTSCFEESPPRSEDCPLIWQAKGMSFGVYPGGRGGTGRRGEEYAGFLVFLQAAVGVNLLAQLLCRGVVVARESLGQLLVQCVVGSYHSPASLARKGRAGVGLPREKHRSRCTLFELAHCWRCCLEEERGGGGCRGKWLPRHVPSSDLLARVWSRVSLLYLQICGCA